MGLANLVPGISGGTMLLAAGVYPAFISSIAELTTLRFRPRSMLLIGTIAVTASVAILLLAGLMRSLVIEQRWVMYSLFIGLTLGGVPLVWRLARPASTGVFIAAAASFGLMASMWLELGGGGGGGASNVPLLFFSGLAGASAMILPGVSGGYLLLLLGQYETILGAIDGLKRGLLGGPDLSLVLESMVVVVPVGVGVVAGIVGVSNLLKWLLQRFEKPTLGALLGLLLGAVVGLWPFQQTIEPAIGDVIDGVLITAENLRDLDVKHWTVEYFRPTATVVVSSLALIVVGFATTVLIARVGESSGDRPEVHGE
jgi:putative membrane protein